MDKSGLPEKLLESLEGIKGFDKNTFVETHRSPEQITSVRFNPAKLSDTDTDLPIDSKVPWSSMGYYLSKRLSFTLDPLYHAGTYYVQEASSMFLEEALKQTVDLSKSIRILDLCAAPGGKSTLISSLISKKSLLVSNELIKTRVGILSENIIKWGTENVIVTNNDPKDFSRLENYFDVIVVDAPCSGSGLFRKDPEALNEWSVESVNLCCARQQRILADAWPALKKNGVLIYSTCSYSKQEDEDILDWINTRFDSECLRLTLEENWNIVESISDQNGYGYRFYPDKVKGEGFFITALRKKEGNDFLFPKSRKMNAEKLTAQEGAVVKKMLAENQELAFIKKADLVYALPSDLVEDFGILHQSLYIKKAGILLGRVAHDQLIPEHDLALSTIISPAINAVTVSKETALRYLRKEEINLEPGLKGWNIIQYENQRLGWVKILQHRVNNYYPLPWKIRM